VPVVAFSPSLWAATLRTLRELTRVAVTALVLVAGLTGPAAASVATDAVRPPATHRLAPEFGPAPELSQAPARVTRTAAVATGPAVHPGAGSRLADEVAAPAPRPDVAVLATELNPAAVTRRGPPRA